ncbi:MAG TPA: S9 family peptidase [Vicinamibacteria bacterium]|jgi:dipeptidyl aminopeptidase/acylaminoacyl peptidase
MLAAVLAASAAVALPAEPFRSQDLHRLISATDARIAPDASRLAYAVIVPEGPGRPESQLWVADLRSGRSVRIAAAGAHGPRWSPDSRRLAFDAITAAGSGLHLADADGGNVSFVAPLEGTNHPLPHAGASLAWSPDGRQIAFVSAVAEAPPPAAADPIVITRYLYKPPAAGAGAERFNDERRLHVFVVDLATHRTRQLTRGPFHEHSIDWSPSGDEILFVSNREPDPDRSFNDDVFAVRAGDGAVRRLTRTRAPEYDPVWSPDGKQVAFLGTRRELTSSETTMEDTHAWVMDAQGGERRELGASIDNRQHEAGWAPDRSAIYCTVQERGSVRLYRLPLSGAPAAAVAARAGAGTIGSWSSARDGTLAYTFTGIDGPAEVYVQTASGARPVTTLNRELVASRTQAAVESFTFPTEGGGEAEAFLTRPAGMAAGQRAPVVVAIHGGPHAQQGPAFNAKAQVYAAAGFATLMVNYRGSTGYGQKWADAIFGDQDGAEARDVLAGLDSALSRFAWLDPARVVLEGGSYGGQLTNWLVTRTDRFRAAVSTSGISNLVSFNYMAYYHDYLAVEFGRYPHESGLMDLLWERSPLRHVARVKTPVLLLHGENDNDVPIAEAEQFYVALKDAGVETVMVRYPREGHGLRETAHVIDAIDRSLDWYRKQLVRGQ